MRKIEKIHKREKKDTQTPKRPVFTFIYSVYLIICLNSAELEKLQSSLYFDSIQVKTL